MKQLILIKLINIFIHLMRKQDRIVEEKCKNKHCVDNNNQIIRII